MVRVAGAAVMRFSWDPCDKRDRSFAGHSIRNSKVATLLIVDLELTKTDGSIRHDHSIEQEHGSDSPPSSQPQGTTSNVHGQATSTPSPANNGPAKLPAVNKVSKRI